MARTPRSSAPESPRQPPRPTFRILSPGSWRGSSKGSTATRTASSASTRTGRTVVRAYRPDATAVEVVLADGTTAPLERIHDAGVFAGDVPATAGDDGYRLQVAYPTGDTVEVGDPYRFWPTLGELDLHLFGEGRHHDLWKHARAPTTASTRGPTGTSFAVWAPNAKAVRVVGDFNGWDGRLHPMRALGSTGVWELFLPDVEPGARYKFEVLDAAGALTLKADPMAFATEVPPGRASIVGHVHVRLRVERRRLARPPRARPTG